ncbi:2-polyprenyl-6-methoxyphenol hydroxylase-like FAD-dependent oxidoreductase [Prauserella shujinwangii]|uniref:2-polyprenyl-6-methoxyphenol hydroxylase-like FAD-dependent oxidoreductase n=1 Tax=Prauserella shujinwangii TaxID=1453103 RepID=A0A2T0LSK4_9PSEU|nr:NAD(P)/FAD-dependent oxidoreductase [Prauserella shujinwangii]PRX46638.1 2-polyprenyl-6-methoxyphenol hydroxylase-like FAD-dependent oxidoreductase [Prauserella shujinwangii]
MSHYDVLICGAGVAGLTLARVLAAQGRRVLVVDKQTRDSMVHKGELLQPRSLQVLDDLGALPALRDREALVAHRLVCCRPSGEEIAPLDYRLLPGPFNYCLVHHYHAITAAIGHELGPRVEIRRGTRLAALHEDSSGRVRGARLVEGGEVRQDVTATLTVGCDGASSRARSEAGIGVTRQPYEHHLVGIDLADGSGLGRDIAAHLTARGLRLLLPMPGGRARLYVQASPAECRELRRDRRRWTERLLADVPALEVVAGSLRADAVRPQLRTAVRLTAHSWTRPGLALLGDAAHCVHPMAGQGMNSAIADAWSLGAALGEVDRFRAAEVDAALERYRAAGEHRMAYVCRLSHNLATLFTDTSPRTRLLGRYLLRRNRTNRRLQFLLTYNMSGLGVHRFTTRDRLVQFGLIPDRRAGEIPAVRAGRVSTSTRRRRP